jgi:single-stranded-DNA-specific exonuclease
VVARLYAARGIRRAEDADLGLAGLLPVGSLDGIDEATELLHRHSAAGNRVLVVGDFDADGATSTALLVRILSGLGSDVGYLVPDRFAHGYGLSPSLVEEASARQPALILTVDSGINCHAGVAWPGGRASTCWSRTTTSRERPARRRPPSSIPTCPASPSAAATWPAWAWPSTWPRPC